MNTTVNVTNTGVHASAYGCITVPFLLMPIITLAARQISVVVNWRGELTARAPVSK